MQFNESIKISGIWGCDNYKLVNVFAPLPAKYRKGTVLRHILVSVLKVVTGKQAPHRMCYDIKLDVIIRQAVASFVLLLHISPFLHDEFMEPGRILRKIAAPVIVKNKQ